MRDIRTRSTTIACAAGVLALGASSAHAQPTASTTGNIVVETVAKGLDHPWALAFLPDGRMLVTERPGSLRIVSRDGKLSPALAGVPKVFASGQGGLLDVAVDPAFQLNQRIYLSYAEGGGSGGRAGTAVLRARLVGTALQDVQVIFRQDPKLSTGNHFGSRLVFDREGHLFITLGENNIRITSQYLDHHQGKVVRLWPDGSIPADNPFVGRDGARPEIWSYGHRNAQGLALHPVSGQVWLHEHGPRGGD